MLTQPQLSGSFISLRCKIYRHISFMALINFPETQRAVHLFQIIFNFLFCPVPVRYSTEIFAKFFHLPPPICIQLHPPGAGSLLTTGQTAPICTLSKLCICFIICEGPCVIQAALWWFWPGSLG